METKENILAHYRNRIIFPGLRTIRRAITKRMVSIEDYILPVRRRKKERVSERVKDILYKRR